ncbi:hypothetical protein EAE96_006905 [Botrytis aclada]|nr:hypothetical protein EAE96_006905 [Botrytis aclada]
MNSESSLREKEIEDLFRSKTSKSFAPALTSAVADMAKMESFLDSVDYQPQPYISDCEFFGFNHEHPRFASNSSTFQFKSWQLKIQRHLAVAQYEELLNHYNNTQRLHENWNAARDERVVHAQLGGGVVQDHDQNRRIIPDIPIRPAPAKPILLIVLPELIQQWAAEIKSFSEDFKVLIYHGDERTANFGSHAKISAKSTNGKLTRDHTIFNGEEENGRVVVITSVGIHGEAGKDLITVYDPDWKYNLEDLFDHINVNGAHILKNCDTMAHQTVAWLKPKFSILATATVFSNCVEDFRGYMSLIEMEEEIWTQDNLERWGVDATVNPYTLPNNHAALVLRFTAKTVDT